MCVTYVYSVVTFESVCYPPQPRFAFRSIGRGQVRRRLEGLIEFRYKRDAKTRSNRFYRPRALF